MRWDQTIETEPEGSTPLIPALQFSFEYETVHSSEYPSNPIAIYTVMFFDRIIGFLTG
jgi:hypothetical protein